MARASGDVDLEFFAGFFGAIDQIEQGEVAAAEGRARGPGRTGDGLAELLLRLPRRPAAGLVGHLPGRARRSSPGSTPSPPATRPPTPTPQGTWALQTGGLAHQAGRLSDHVPLLLDMIDGTALGDIWLGPLALARLLAGDREEATELLERFVDPPLDYFWMTATQAMSEVAAMLPHPAMADEFFRRLLPFRDQVGITASGSFCYGYVALTLANLAIARGTLDEAIELGQEALRKADAAGAPFESVRARRILAQALRAAGRPDDGDPTAGRPRRPRGRSPGLPGRAGAARPRVLTDGPLSRCALSRFGTGTSAPAYQARRVLVELPTFRRHRRERGTLREIARCCPASHRIPASVLLGFPSR